MDDAPPQLGDIVQHSAFSVPTLSTTTIDNNSVNDNGSAIQNVKGTVYSKTQSAMDTVSNHPVTQNVKDTIGNGPIAENIKDQHAKTSSEFADLADSRKTPKESAATGQPLTHYHSFFYNLLSWKNPRATAISFAVTVLFIFAARYLPALRWSFKVLYLTLGVTAAAEVAGKLVLSRGLTSSFRPRKYYTIPRESLEASLEDIEQFINFFVIEFQRILFAENVVHTIAAFVATVISYWLIKIVPLWGLSLIGVSTMYLAPLIYISNKEVIDQHLENATSVVNSQAAQVKDLASHHTAAAAEAVKGYAGDYTAKAQEIIGGTRTTAKSNGKAPLKSGPGAPPAYTSEDFPHAPKQELVDGVTSHTKQYEDSQFGGKAELAI